MESVEELRREFVNMLQGFVTCGGGMSSGLERRIPDVGSADALWKMTIVQRSMKYLYPYKHVGYG